MNNNENTTANSVNTPTMLSMYRLTAIGIIRAVIPTIMHASTITVPQRSPIAMSEWPFLTLCSANVNSGSVVPSATITNPTSIAGTPIPSASASELLTMKCALAIIKAMHSASISALFR